MANLVEDIPPEKQMGINVGIIKKLTQALELLEKVDCDDAKKTLKEAIEMTSSLNKYAVSRSTPISSLLQTVIHEIEALDCDKLHLEGKLIHTKSNSRKMMMITHTGQVQLLQFLVRKLKCRNILEVGTFMGYGAFGMVEVMAPGGKVTGIDIERYFCDFVNKTARERNINVEVKQGDAISVLKSLAKEGNAYDFIYVDCVKEDYPEYYKIIMDNGMLAPDGVMACDNTIFTFRAILRNSDSGKCLDDFNKLVTQDPRVRYALLPCYDGLLLIQHDTSNV